MFDYLSISNWCVLLPSIVTFIVVLINQRAVPALLAGILTSIILQSFLFDKNIIQIIIDHMLSGFMREGGVNWDNILILLFLWMLGTLIVVLNHSGAIEIIANILNNNIKSNKHAKLSTFFLGLICFIDDYFNSLAIGAAAQGLFDKRGISRQKLAYYLDTTAAPVCILVPFSSWGAVIINVLDNTITNLKIPGYSNGFELFISSAYYNFYSIISLGILLFVSLTNFDFPLMARYEKKSKEALIDNKDSDVSRNTSISFSKDKLYSAFGGLLGLFGFALIFMMLSGYYGSERSAEFSMLDIISNIKLGISLFMGSIVGIAIACYFHPIKISAFVKLNVEGYGTMSSAIKILVLAWVFSYSMSELNVGSYISSLMHSSVITSSNLPAVAFIAAGCMSILTGTSWVTFSVLLPIVSELCLQYDLEVLPVTIAGVLAGAVFGDHCSPISDTTILSSTGAGCNHMEHFNSQLPYCVVAALLSLLIFMQI